MSDYASGDRALQVWYRDSTLRWVRWDDMEKSQARGLAGAMEFQEDATPPFRRIEPEALRLLFVAGALDRAQRWPAALDTLRRADALQADREAHHFVGRVLGLEAWCLGASGHVPEAEQVARQSVAVAPENADGHLTLAAVFNGRNQWNQSLAQLDTLLAWYPGYRAGVMMREEVVRRMREQGAAPANPGMPPPASR
jgi:tetratricopeptide (TPR) repeat protein